MTERQLDDIDFFKEEDFDEDDDLDDLTDGHKFPWAIATTSAIAGILALYSLLVSQEPTDGYEAMQMSRYKAVQTLADKYGDQMTPEEFETYVHSLLDQ